MPSVNLEDVGIAEYFRNFVEEVASSPLYVALCPLLAVNHTAISVYNGARPTQRRPNLLFAAMHSSILRDPSHELAGWYATVGGLRSPADPALAPVLDSFLHERLAELTALVADGATQTNEIGRSALILPALADVYANARRPLGLVEIGTSGGLNLRLDAYRVTYTTSDEQPDNGSVSYGPPTSSVHIRSDASRSQEPISSAHIESIVIGSRKGSDLNPLNVHDETQSRWLRSLIWPDESQRFQRLSEALELAKSIPVDIVRGDAVDLVGDQIRTVPSGEHPVLLTTWVLTYLTPKHRSAFVAELDAVAHDRPFSWVCMEHPFYCSGIPWPDDVVEGWTTPKGPRTFDSHVAGNPVVVHTFNAGKRSSKWIATAHPHGRWINWHPNSSAAMLP